MAIDFSTIIAAPKIDAILASQQINGFEAAGGTDKQTYHSYGPVYEALMAPLIKSKKPVAILEVGVQLGGSLLLWHDLCKKAKVIGVDAQNLVHPSIFPRMEQDRLVFILGDGYIGSTIEQVKAAAPDGLDFAIDDGPHSLDSQCRFIELYVPLLKDGGIAVVEDVQDYGWFDELIKRVPENCSHEIVDRRAIKGRYDDLMIIIRRQTS